MSLTHEQFERLVAKLELRAQADPKAYARRVVLLAALGNAYLVLVLLLLAAIFIGMLASILVLKLLGIKLALFAGVLLWTVVKALWVPSSRPAGLPLARAQAPELFALVDELRARLKTEPVHGIYITDEFNAGIQQRPRLGIFGWPRNYLFLGMPLLASLSVAEFRSVLAHELGHLSKGHGRVSNWVYRQRLRWHRLQELFEARPSKAQFLFRPFLQWYAPYMLAYSFPLARANEYEADASGARLTSPRIAASALTRTEIIARYLSREYWPAIYRSADEQPRPGFLPYTELAGAVATRIEPQMTQAWLAEALQEKTGVADTHPCLSDRLKALGEAPQLEAATGPDAAQALLGASCATLTAALQDQWWQRIRDSWQQSYESAQKDRARLAELDTLAVGGTALSPQQAYDRALLRERVAKDEQGALELLRELHARLPQNGTVALSLGARLLRHDDGAGLELVRKAMELDPEVTGDACTVLRDYHWRMGEREQAKQWQDRLYDAQRRAEQSHYERNHLLLSDRLEPHGLAPADLAALQEALRALVPQGLGATYLVRKRVQRDTGQPLYVLGFRVRTWLPWQRANIAPAVLARINATIAFPGETLIISLDGKNYRFGRKLRWRRGSRIV